MSTEKLQWHAGKAYNQENGEHLRAERNGHKYVIEKEVLQRGRTWRWMVAVYPSFGGEIWAGNFVFFLRDAKKMAEYDFEGDIEEMRQERQTAVETSDEA